MTSLNVKIYVLSWEYPVRVNRTFGHPQTVPDTVSVGVLLTDGTTGEPVSGFQDKDFQFRIVGAGSVHDATAELHGVQTITYVDPGTGEEITTTVLVSGPVPELGLPGNFFFRLSGKGWPAGRVAVQVYVLNEFGSIGGNDVVSFEIVEHWT